MQSDWSRVFSITTRELDYSKPCSFYRFSKLMYRLKQRNHIDWRNLSSKSVLLIFSDYLGHAWPNPKKITWSNCDFHENLTTFKKETLYLSFCDIKTSIILQSNWSQAFSYITWERDFSKTYSFCRIIKTTMVHHVNPKIAHQSKKIFANSKKPYF